MTDLFRSEIRPAGNVTESTAQGEIRSASPPPVGGGVGSEARPAPRPTPQPGSPSVYHTLAATQRGESNAGPVEIPMMALPKDSAIARRSVFNLSLSGRPGPSKAEGGGEKTKTRKQRGPGGPALRIRPRREKNPDLDHEIS